MSSRSVVVALVLVVGLSGPVASQVFPVTDLVVNGPTDQRVNVVFLGEGYTAGEMGQFITDAQNAASILYLTPPYQDYASYFNVYAVEVPSNESGTDHPGTASDEPGGLATFTSDTYFHSTFDFGGIHRLLVPNTSWVDFALQNNFPEWDIAFLIVNHGWYGGSGGTAATFSQHSASAAIAIHELGHSFADLNDEYETGGLPGFEGPNTTAETTRELIRWNSWIDSLTPVPTPESGTYAAVVGLFEGAVYNPTGWFRPRLNCYMRTLGRPYCQVCAEQTILSVYNLISTVDEQIPPDTPSVFYDHRSYDFAVETVQPLQNTLEIEWRVDAAPVTSGLATFTFDAASYDAGLHVIEAVVRDTTSMVRNDPGGLLTSTVSWHVPTITIPYERGDVNSDSSLTSADIIYMVNFVFKGGPPPQPVLEWGDVNCDDVNTSADIIYLVNHIFKGGPAPAC